MSVLLSKRGQGVGDEITHDAVEEYAMWCTINKFCGEKAMVDSVVRSA